MEHSLYETCKLTVSFGITVETITILYKFQKKYIYILITHLTKAFALNTIVRNWKMIDMEND